MHQKLWAPRTGGSTIRASDAPKQAAPIKSWGRNVRRAAFAAAVLNHYMNSYSQSGSGRQQRCGVKNSIRSRNSPPGGTGMRRSVRAARPKALENAQQPLEEVVEVEEGAEDEEEEVKSEEYSEEMQRRMGGSLVYRHEDGINWHDIADQLIVGSCLQTPDDVDRVREEAGIDSVLCLQMDSDMEYFSLDIDPIIERCGERGDIRHIRYRIRDFDPFDLRMRLAGAVALVKRELDAGRKIYIHCTAGMGRAPATALAYLYWCRGVPLKEAHAAFVETRPCNPRVAAIREATRDILFSRGRTAPVRIQLYRSMCAESLQVAGLDVGWGEKVDLKKDLEGGCWRTERELPAGRYPFKFIINGRWTYSVDHPVFLDGDNLNNFVDVDFDIFDLPTMLAKKRLLSEDCALTPEERLQINTYLDLLAASEELSAM